MAMSIVVADNKNIILTEMRKRAIWGNDGSIGTRGVGRTQSHRRGSGS
jgi:hypothetical protein